MSLPRYAASVPVGTLPIACLEFSHPLWAGPHRRVIQPNDVTVTISGTPTLFPGWDQAGAWLGEYPAADDSARATRALSLDDPANALLALIESAAESATPVTGRLWLFLSTNLTVPVLAETYTVQTAAPDDGVLELACVSRDITVLQDPVIRATRMNSPGLRGR